MSRAVVRRQTLAPEAALRAALGSGGFAGASGTRRALAEWLVGERSADADSLGDLSELRARSRDLVRNEPLASAAINTNVTSTIGTGLRVQPRINRRLLGLTEEQADAWERDARAFFNAVADELDITRTQTFVGLQDLACRSPLESGDLFVVRRYRKNRGDVLGLKLQLIEAERVSNPNRGFDTARLRAGVELDTDGAPVLYHIADRHPGDLYAYGLVQWHAVPAFAPRSGERQVLHLFKRRRPGQTRGIPYLAPAIEPFKQLSRLTEAELMGSLISAMLTVFIETQADETDVSPLAPVGEDVEANADEATDITETGRYKLESGTAVELLPGEKVTPVASNRPNPAFEAFIEAIVRHMSAGLELPYEVVIKHFRASYSASRAALLEAWRYFMVSRQWVASSFCQPVYEWVIAEGVSRGFLEAPGFFSDPLTRRAWTRARWIGDTPGQIDPKKEADASAIRLREALSTLEIETAAISGADWEEVVEQRAKEVRMLRAAGLDIEPVAERIRTEQPAEEPEDDDLEEEEA